MPLVDSDLPLVRLERAFVFDSDLVAMCTFIFSDLNNKVVFTNLGGSHAVSENTNVGATVFEVSYNDADGDTPTFTATYAPPACSSLFAVGASGMFPPQTLTTLL